MKQILVFFLCLCFFYSNAQEVQILNEVSQEPIIGVAVYNPTKSKSVVSDFDGIVDISLFDPNERLIFQHLSYFKKVISKSNVKSKIYLSPKSQDLDQIVISASKFEQSKKEVPQKIISLKATDIEFSNPQTSADLLQTSGQVFVQKSQLGGGSPMIRGFSTNRLLLSVDGVRMNNAIFRGGNVQNVISIDPFAIQNTEVILGGEVLLFMEVMPLEV